MDGICYNKREEYKKTIQEWIAEAIKNKYWESYKELHIDEISKDFNNYKDWIEGALFILKIFKECLYDDHRVLLVIELNYSRISIENNIIDWQFLKHNISHFTPPAFYLFPEADSRLIATLKDLNFAPSLNIDWIKSNFKEEFDGEDYLCTFYFTW